jgi:hypothetical protein
VSVAFKLCGGRRYQSVAAAAPTGASGNTSTFEQSSPPPHAHLLADFCNKIGTKGEFTAAQQIVCC